MIYVYRNTLLFDSLIFFTPEYGFPYVPLLEDCPFLSKITTWKHSS